VQTLPIHLAIRSAVTALAICCANAAQATITFYAANLSGPNESPPNASPGTGTAIVTIDDVLNTMRVQVSFSGLLGTTTASHIHTPTAVPGTGTAGVATTTPTFPGFPLGVTSGTYDQLFDLLTTSTYNPAFVTANGGTITAARTALLNGISSGEAYLNIHTSVVPGGEIRGFLVAVVPEPASWALMLIGFGAIGLGMRRQRKAYLRVA
jgi:hypothetical protein